MSDPVERGGVGFLVMDRAARYRDAGHENDHSRRTAFPGAFRPRRLYDAPVKIGLRKAPTVEADPHPITIFI